MYNIGNVGWQLVHYTIYGTKSNTGLGFALTLIAFHSPLYRIVDSPPSNIGIIYAFYLRVLFTGVAYDLTYGTRSIWTNFIIYVSGRCNVNYGLYGSAGTCIIN